MKNLVLLTQGSQAIQLVRTLFGLGYRPNQLTIYTIDAHKNNCFIEFLKYYNIKYYTQIENQNWVDKLVISFGNLNKIKINKNTTYINFHPGLLPSYKGSLSTVYSMLNNEEYVGGTWHYMTDKIDAGNVLHQFKIKILEQDTAFSLNHKIFQQSLDCLQLVLNKIKCNDLGKVQSGNGKFYLNKFPDLSSLDRETQRRINYFPPNFEGDQL
tara:strand:+ start:31 stop:666 length:636 start_codon:yes stop_codon:yes gene_type:complete